MSNMFYNNNQQHISIVQQCKGVTLSSHNKKNILLILTPFSIDSPLKSSCSSHLPMDFSMFHRFPLDKSSIFPGLCGCPSHGQRRPGGPRLHRVLRCGADLLARLCRVLGHQVRTSRSRLKNTGTPRVFFLRAFRAFHVGHGFSWFLMVSLTIWGTYTENRHTLGTLVVYHHFHFFKDTNFLEFHMSTGRENPKTSPAAHPAEFNARILSWSISRAAATWSGPFCVLSRKLLHR